MQKQGWRGGKPAVSNVCRVSARPGWQQHEHLSQETSVLLSHSTAGQSIWLQCCANSINSYLPFRSYYAEYGMTEEYNGRSPKWRKETGSVWLPRCLLACCDWRIVLQSLFLLACVAGQRGASPTVYVRGIIRISDGAGRGEWAGNGEKISSEGGLRDRWWRRENEVGKRATGDLLKKSRSWVGHA